MSTLVEQRVQRPLPGLSRLAGPAHALKLRPGAGPQLAEGVELAGGLGELVVELGQLLDLDAVDGHGHLSQLAGLLAAGQHGGERLGLARGHPDQGLVEPVEHLPAADLVGDAVGLRVLDRLPVHLGGQVDRDEVALGGRPVGALERGEPLPQRADVLLDLVRGDVGVVDRHRQPVDVGQVELRPDVDLGGEREFLAVVELGDLQVRLAERVDVVLLERLAVQLRDGVVHRLLEHGAAADPLVDDARRDPARAEAGYPDLPGDLAIRPVEVRLQLIERNLDGEPDSGRAQLFDVGLHVGVTPRLPSRAGIVPRPGHRWLRTATGHARLGRQV